MNVRAPFLLIRAALPYLKKTGADRIVNVASTGGKRFREGPSVWYLRRPERDMTEADFAAHLIGKLEVMIEREGPKTIVAFIGEPVLGTGGIVLPPEGHWAGVATLKLVDSLGLVENAAQTGPYLPERLKDAVGGHPKVDEVRGVGLLEAVEFMDGPDAGSWFDPMSVTQKIAAEMLRRGVIARLA